MTEEVAEELRKKNISVAVIPGGCTSKIQPLDVSLSRAPAEASEWSTCNKALPSKSQESALRQHQNSKCLTR